MQIKIIAFPVLFILCFSLNGFSQTTEKSSHPLLDKYYPQKQNTASDKPITAPINPTSETKPTPEVTTTPAAIVTPRVKTTISTATTTPALNTTPPAITTTSTITTPPSTDKPIIVTTAPAPVQKKIQTQQAPPAPPYMDTRLGSSSKMYDTWKKNNNGAGAVTTNPNK